MDKKRKSKGGDDNADDHATKKRKMPSDNIDLSQPETAEGTSQQGLKLVEILKKTEDKSGRIISTSFLTLPNRQQFPEYYKQIRMPIALDTVREKLVRREFKNLTDLESFFKRMISNAKEFNTRGSEVYDDAERLRKALSNYMTKHNPAYKLIPGYVAAPTPFPAEPGESDDEDAEGEPDSEAEAAVQAKKITRGRSKPQLKTQPPKKSATPSVQDGVYAGVAFSKLNFQQAQEKILEVLITQKESPDELFSTFEVFVELPNRSLRDYYKLITNPASLGSVQKRVKGGKDNVSEFKSWAAFEKEMKYIWNNAWKYNEDGSEISNLAKDLQDSFYKLFKEAKQTVAEPAGHKIKLRMPEQPPPQPTQKLKLKLGRASPAESPAPQASVPNTATVNGTGRNPFKVTSSAPAPVPVLDQLEKARSASVSVSSPTPSAVAPVKNEEGARNSPAINAVAYTNQRGGSQAVSTPGLPTPSTGMPPPSTPGLANNGVATNGNNTYTNGYAQSFPHQPQIQPQHSSFESKWRQPGKTAADAMMTNLSLATHPGLHLTHHFHLDLPPSATMAQQSITINLPHTHYYLQIKPTISSSLLDRQYKLFVTSGSQRLHAMPSVPGHPMDQRRPLFEARLLPGVNRIELELIAALPKGANKTLNGQDVELEKITVFAHLLKDPQQR